MRFVDAEGQPALADAILADAIVAAFYRRLRELNATIMADGGPDGPQAAVDAAGERAEILGVLPRAVRRLPAGLRAVPWLLTMERGA